MLVVDCPLKLMQDNSRWRQTTSSPHFSSGIVERAWKSSHARKARRDGESFFLSSSSRLSRLGWFFTRARVSLALLYPWAGLIPEEKWGLLVVCAAGGTDYSYAYTFLTKLVAQWMDVGQGSFFFLRLWTNINKWKLNPERPGFALSFSLAKPTICLMLIPTKVSLLFLHL